MRWEDIPFYGSTCGYRMLLVRISPQCVGVFRREYEMAKVENSPKGKDDTSAQTHVSVASRNSFFNEASKQADFLKSHCMVLQLLGGWSILIYLICYNTMPCAVGQSDSITSNSLHHFGLFAFVSFGIRFFSWKQIVLPMPFVWSSDLALHPSAHGRPSCPRACLSCRLCRKKHPFDVFYMLSSCTLCFSMFFFPFFASTLSLPCTLQVTELLMELHHVNSPGENIAPLPFHRREESEWIQFKYKEV